MMLIGEEEGIKKGKTKRQKKRLVESTSTLLRCHEFFFFKKKVSYLIFDLYPFFNYHNFSILFVQMTFFLYIHAMKSYIINHCK